VKAFFHPPQCSECLAATRFIADPSAPGGFVWCCSSEHCHEYGQLYELPQFEAEPWIAAALLRRNLRLMSS
jgi:hypothetical protein